MSGEQVVKQTRDLKKAFGCKCSKFAGAVSVEVLRAGLLREGVRTSPRDVFIQGIPVELDLVIPRESEEPVHGLLYEPRQVAAALEVKNSGVFSEAALERLRLNAARIREADIPFAYVTLEERRGYRWAPSCERLGSPCFTLAWHRATGGPIEPTDDWRELVKFLSRCIQTPPRA